MHWADQIADSLLQAHPERDHFVCAAGISPSGSVHIGNFRDVATVYFVARALRDRGKAVRLIFSWDEFDRFRKVPANLPPAYSEFIGLPYSRIPDPWGCHASYAEHFEREFESAMGEMGIELDYLYQEKEYLSGRYAPHIQQALMRRKEIHDLLAGFRTQEQDQGERENYYPLSIYCHACGKDNTRVTALAPDAATLSYRCRCGHEQEADLTRGGPWKLPWKVDWPMRWMVEGVDFEPGGKDHAAAGGSYQVAKAVVGPIFNAPAPLFQGYEFVGITGGAGKMSSSSGMTITTAEMLRVYQPEMIKWFFAKYAPKKSFNISLGEELYRTYDEFDRAYQAYQENRDPELEHRTMAMALQGRPLHPVPFRQLASFANIAHGSAPFLENLFIRLGEPWQEPQFRERLAKAEHWLRHHAPESAIQLRDEPDTAYFQTLSVTEQGWIVTLREQLSQTADPSQEELTTLLYAIPKNPDDPPETGKVNQRRFFEVIYTLLIGKTTGPRLATFLKGLGREKIVPLLPKT